MAADGTESLQSLFDDIFKAYDVRGIVPDELDARVAYAVGVGFGRFVLSQDLADKRIVLGRDIRESGVLLSRALSAGVLSVGLGVVDIGLASTDLLYFASGKLNLAGAMLTASHNPPAYNGIKLCLPGARPIGRDSGLGDIRPVAEATYPAAPADGGADGVVGDERVEHLELLDEFAAHVRSFVDIARLRALKVVADTANGMGGLVVPRVFAGLPFELEILFGELDGSFPNHPANPIEVENLSDLRARILASHADVGLAFDGDADRVFLVDERGEPMSGSLTTAIVAATMLERFPGSKILYNLICSHAVPEIITERGGIPIRTRVGPLVHKGGDGRDRCHLRRRALGALLLPGQLPGGLGDHRGAHRARGSLQGHGPPLAAEVPLRALLGLGRDQHRGTRPGFVDRPRRRALPGRGCQDRRPRRDHSRARRLVVQPAPVEHRAALEAQSRGAGRPRVRATSRRGARPDPQACGEPDAMSTVS